MTKSDFDNNFVEGNDEHFLSMNINLSFSNFGQSSRMDFIFWTQFSLFAKKKSHNLFSLGIIGVSQFLSSAYGCLF